MKMLFLESLPYRSAVRVGSHAYASRFAAIGWETLWISQPISPLHVFHPVKRDWPERIEGWLRGPLDRDGVRYYSPFTLAPTASVPLLRTRFVADMSVAASVPPLVSVVRRAGFLETDVAWLTNPVFEPLVRRLDVRCLAVRLADDHAKFRNVPDSITDLQQRALERADVIFVAASVVRERLKDRYKNVVWLPNGVDFNHFVHAREEPSDIAGIPRPRVVYVGALEYWFDAATVARTARMLVDVQFLIIGPVNRDLGALSRCANVHVLGPRPYSTLPGYLHHCECAVLPFVRDEMVDAVHPIKVYEYLAAGLPVVASRWTELERMNAPISLAAPEEFPSAVADALSQGTRAGREERVAYARANTWDARFAVASSWLTRVLEQKTAG